MTVKIRNLVFQGGSIQGIAYLGALRKLFADPKYGVDMKDILRIGGTSAGAITAIGLAIGYSLEEMEVMMSAVDFRDFLDGERRDDFLAVKEELLNSRLSIMNILSHLLRSPIRSRNMLFKLQKDYGLFNGEYFRRWIEDKIAAKTGIAHLTFAELHMLKKTNPQYKDVYFVGANIGTNRSEIFSYEHTPDMIISDAVRISMSIPILFVPHERYVKRDNKRTLDESGQLYVDGGIIDNYPVWLFDNTKYLPSHPKNSKHTPLSFNRETLGFRLIFYTPKSANENAGFSSHNKKGFIPFLFALFACYSEKQESDHYHRSDVLRTIYIDTLGTSMFDFDLSVQLRHALMEQGQFGVDEYFKRLSEERNHEVAGIEILWRMGERIKKVLWKEEV